MRITRELLEDTAARTVGKVLQADYELHDTPGRSAAYDFIIIRGEEGAALEVTQATDLATEKLFGAFDKYGSSFDAEALREHWMVAVEAPSEAFRSRDLKALQRALLQLISTLEAQSRTHFDCHRPDEPERTLCATYPFVKFGSSFEMDGAPSVWLNHAPVVSFDAEDLLAVAEDRARLEDNRTKLARSGLEERHLFVWVNVWELAAAAAYAQGAPPPRAPDLPEEVTDLWVGRLTDGGVEVWHFGQQRWNYHEVPIHDPVEQ